MTLTFIDHIRLSVSRDGDAFGPDYCVLWRFDPFVVVGVRLDEGAPMMTVSGGEEIEIKSTDDVGNALRHPEPYG